jgi:hypothetical protein
LHAETQVVGPLLIALVYFGLLSWDGETSRVTICDSAWKKDPLGGVIGVQKGPLTLASVMHGGHEQDAGCGDCREDPAGVFCSGQVDQGDLP